MNKYVLVICFLFILQSCIPIRIAPTIEDYKLSKGKRFKKGLPKREMFIFSDAKDAEEFYNFINIKYQLNDENVYDDVPFIFEDEQFFFSWYEVEIPNKSINLLPIFIDAALTASDMDPVLEDAYSSRKGNWYVAIEVYNDFESDCLVENSLSKEKVLKYLRALKEEYLVTHNYNETIFKN